MDLDDHPRTNQDEAHRSDRAPPSEGRPGPCWACGAHLRGERCRRCGQDAAGPAPTCEELAEALVDCLATSPVLGEPVEFEECEPEDKHPRRGRRRRRRGERAALELHVGHAVYRWIVERLR